MQSLPQNWSVIHGTMHCEDVPLGELAQRFGTPLYVYSSHHIRNAYQRLSDTLGGNNRLICYSVKANSNLAILRLLVDLGAGFDIVSGGELQRVLLAGGEPKKIVFSGVGKSETELEEAMNVGINCFNVESEGELDLLASVAAKRNQIAPVALRVNPDVDPGTHPYISTGLQKNKFGVPIERAVNVYRRIAEDSRLEIRGIDCHIGSQLTDLSPMLDALSRVLALWDTLALEGIQVPQIDMGGGVGIQYRDEKDPDLTEFGWQLTRLVGERPVRMLFEPGRSLVGNAGVMLTRVRYTKETPAQHFAIVDGAMTDLIRPSLYQAYQRILPVDDPQRCSEGEGRTHVVGPVCESGDFLGLNRDLDFVEPGDLLAVLSSGAYGFVMASNYNTRPRAAEVLVDGSQYRLIRRRETIAELLAAEQDLEAGS